MLILLGTTVTASFFDSLNPSAIAQQMLLQAMVKNKRHIRFFYSGYRTCQLCSGLGSVLWSCCEAVCFVGGRYGCLSRSGAQY